MSSTFFIFFQKTFCLTKRPFSLKSDGFQKLLNIFRGKGMHCVAELAGHGQGLAVGCDLGKLLASERDQRGLHALPGAHAAVAEGLALQNDGLQAVKPAVHQVFCYPFRYCQERQTE